MAAAYMLSEPISELYDLVIHAAETTHYFRPQLKQLKSTLDSINPIIYDMKYQNRRLDRTDEECYTFATEQVVEYSKIVSKGLEIKPMDLRSFGTVAANIMLVTLRAAIPIGLTYRDQGVPSIYTRVDNRLKTHSQKLKDINESLLRFFHIDDQAGDIKQTLLAVIDLKLKVTIKRAKLGWAVPRLPRRVVIFHELLEKLKAKVLDDNESSVVVVSAAAGCGKSTLVNILCRHPDIQERYGENVFYVTVSESPNFMEIVNDLLNSNPFSQQVSFHNNEYAKFELETLFREKVSGPILLVLDDVYSDSFIKNFEFDIDGYKILVTSRMVFPAYDVFLLDPLSDEDAMALFHFSAFNYLTTNPTIDDDLVNQMVKCCKKHPLTLSVVATSLNGKYQWVWKSVLKKLSKVERVVDNNDALNHLKQTIMELEMEFSKFLVDVEALDQESKKCLLDLGLFPGDQRISACALLDMWVNMYDHDYMGRDSLTKIFELLDRNFVSSITIGKEANAIVNYCEQTYIRQQDLLREFAIHLSSINPIADRRRLIIDAQGSDLPTSFTEAEQPMQARILSISTGESFSSRWCEMEVPDVEVLVLNLKSKAYTIPNFLKKTQKLKILNVTNYGLLSTEIQNFHLLGSSTNLRRIRLEHIVISPLSTAVLSLLNLEKISFVMCKIGSAFEKVTTDNTKVWPSLVEIEMDNCQDLVEFPGLLCNCVHLKTLSITNCDEMCELPEEFGKLTSMEILSLRSCKNIEKLPESISSLQKLRILEISDCSRLSELPVQIGRLGSLQMIYMKGCTRIQKLPPSVKELSQTQVVCSEEMSCMWKEFPNVKTPVMEEDRLLNLTRNISHLNF